MFQENVILSAHSNYKIGGPAKYFSIVKKADQLPVAVEKARRFRLPIFILGGGTNLLISDEGFNGLVIRPEIKKLEIEKSGKAALVKVGAGISVSEFQDFLISQCFSGLEWAGGLPGTIGGAIRGNAGAFGGEMKDIVKEVISLDISGRQPKVVKRNNQECRFDYRDSIFKRQDGREIILEAVLAFKKGSKKDIQTAIEEKIKYRQERQPLDYPNIGSIFKNVALPKCGHLDTSKFSHVIKTDPFPVIPVAYLIAETGLKGVHCGGAMISPKHPNFIVNVLKAGSEDVRNLIKLVKAEVKKKFKVELEEEIIYV